MISPHRRGIGWRRLRASRSGSTRARRSRRFVLGPELEFLEERLTPTGNLTITSAAVVDANEQPLTSISAGDWVFIEADFSSEDLPSDASYRCGASPTCNRT